MSSEKLKEGDLVRLRSGGPLMTVVNPGGLSGWPVCNWFEGGKVQTGIFPPAALAREPGRAGGPGGRPAGAAGAG